MSDIISIAIFVILAPFLAYMLFRIVSSAIFRSWFESKHEFEKKDSLVKDVRKNKND